MNRIELFNEVINGNEHILQTNETRSAKSLARYEMINPDCELDYDIACLAHIVLQKEALSVFSTEFAMKVQSTRESQL
ncbi:unnamed protein product [Caenorhabditis nigoni]